MNGPVDHQGKDKPFLSIIVAMDERRAIGRGNDLIWRLPADLAHFKKTTMGHVILMGRKTFESIGKPLPGRTNAVMSRNRDYRPIGCETVHSMEEALERFRGQKVYVIGGEEIYRMFMPVADELIVTELNHVFDGADAHFPEIDPGQWTLVSEREGTTDFRNPYLYRFLVYGRKRDFERI